MTSEILRHAAGATRALMLACAALASACGASGDDATPGVLRLADGSPPNVLVITLDTVRTDRLGAYGHAGRTITPRLDALAEESILFEQAFATSSFTPPTHASILTSLYPAEHGLLFWNKRLADVPTAAEAFAAAGWRTFAVTPLPTLLKLGLDRGFHDGVSPEHHMDGEQLMLGDADAINALALERTVVPDDSRPFFAWLHYYDAHRPFGRQGEEWAFRYVDEPGRRRPEVGATEAWYQLTVEKRERLGVGPDEVELIADRYDGGLAWLDDRIGRLLDALAEQELLERTIVVVVADHGEVFDEHEPEWFAHDPYLVDENVHIPLLVRLPASRHAGRRVPDLVSQVDILPTLFELTGVAPLAGQLMSGRSLVPGFAGQPLRTVAVFGERQGNDLSDRRSGPAPAPAEVAKSRDRKAMLRTATRKLLLSTDRKAVELLDVTGPRPEQLDLSETEPDTLKQALLQYERWSRNQRLPGQVQSVPFDSEMEELLRGLGYLGEAEDGR